MCLKILLFVYYLIYNFNWRLDLVISGNASFLQRFLLLVRSSILVIIAHEECDNKIYLSKLHTLRTARHVKPYYRSYKNECPDAFHRCTGIYKICVWLGYKIFLFKLYTLITAHHFKPASRSYIAFAKILHRLYGHLQILKVIKILHTYISMHNFN